jgi:hypothetical protein
MTRLFTAGAEAGSLGVFSAVGGLASVSAAQKRTGAFAFLQGSTTTGLLGTVVFAADKTQLYYRIGLYLISTYPASNTYAALVQLFDNAGGWQCALSINQVDKTLHVVRGRGTDGVDLGGTANPVPLNQWCCIEWYIKIDDGVAGASTVKIDGVTGLTIPAADTKSTAVAGVRSMQYSPHPLGAVVTNGIYGYFDDLAINDIAGPPNNSWIGRGGIYVSVSEAAGTYTDLHASAGNAWDCINEVPPSDVDYVSDDTVDQKSTYGMTAITPATGTIACINVIMRAIQSAAGTANIARLIRSNGTDSQGADVGLDVTAKTIQENIETDPGEIAGTAWTIAAVNALEAGCTIR